MDLHLSRESDRAFHGNFRAPKRSRPRLTVTHEGLEIALAIDVGIGKGGAERVVQTITRVGQTEMTENVADAMRVAFRAREIPIGEVIISVDWKDRR